MDRKAFVKDSVEGWAKAVPSADLQPLEVLQLLIWTGRSIEDLLEKASIAGGLRRRGDYEVLALLRRSEPAELTPIEVAEALRSSPSGMTGKLDRLETQGLIERKADPTDRRVVKLRVTDIGRALADQAFRMSLDLYEAMLDGFDAPSRQALKLALLDLLANVETLTSMSQPWNLVQPTGGGGTTPTSS
jgi:DNA-binding MarR family transcriptional regulator